MAMPSRLDNLQISHYNGKPHVHFGIELSSNINSNATGMAVRRKGAMDDEMMLKFPNTKTILWDHTPTSSPVHLHISYYRSPKLKITERVIKFAQRHLESSGQSEILCTLVGSLAVDNDGEGVTFCLDRFDPGGNLSNSSGTLTSGDIAVPLQIFGNSKTEQTSSLEEYLSALKVLKKRCQAKDAIELSNFLLMKSWCRFYTNGEKNIHHVEFDIVTIGKELKATPVAPVPIVPSALSKNLSGPMSLSHLQGEPKTGYLTMDHTRKLLLVLESDPKVANLPLVGIWISGVAHIYHPFVWAACLRYMYNDNICDRICATPEPFLVILYSPLHSKPEFYEVVPIENSTKMNFDLFAGYEIISIPKSLTSCAREIVEVDLNKVNSGTKADVFDGAKNKFFSQFSSSQKELKKPVEATSSDEITPRCIPAPHKTQLPTAMSMVPEVSLIFGEDGQSGMFQDAGSRKFPINPGRPQGVNVLSEFGPQRPLSSFPSVTSMPQHQHLSIQSRGPAPKSSKPPHSYSAPDLNQIQHHVKGPRPPRSTSFVTERMDANTVHSLPSDFACSEPHRQMEYAPRVCVSSALHGAHSISQQQPHYGMPAPSHIRNPISLSTQTQQAVRPSHYNKQHCHRLPQELHAQFQGLPTDCYPPQQQFLPPHSAPAKQIVPQYSSVPYSQAMQGSQQQPPCSQILHHTAPYSSAQPNFATPNSYSPGLSPAVEIGQVQNTPFPPETQSHPPPLPVSSYQQHVGGLLNAPPNQVNQGQASRRDETPPETRNNSTQGDSSKSSDDSGLSFTPEKGQAPGSKGATSSPFTEPSKNAHLSLGASNINWNQVPKEVYQLLLMQNEQLQKLQSQIQVLMQNQSASTQCTTMTDLPASGNNTCDCQSKSESAKDHGDTEISWEKSKDRTETCSVAVNTTMLPVERVSHSVQTSPQKPCAAQRQVSISRSDTSSSLSDRSRGSHDPHTPAEIRHRGRLVLNSTEKEDLDIDVSEENLSCVVDNVALHNKTMDSVQSDMILDLPSYHSSPTSQLRDSTFDSNDTLTKEDRSNSPISASMCGRENFSSSQHDEDSDDDLDETVGNTAGADTQEYYDKLMQNIHFMLNTQNTEDGMMTLDSEGQGEVTKECIQQSIMLGRHLDSMQALQRNSDGMSSGSDTTFIPKINYMSLMFDSDSDSSMEINQIAMKYLKDEQLTQMMKHNARTSALRGKSKENQRLAVLKHILKDDSNSTPNVTSVGMSPNDMTFATKKYLERHGLLSDNSSSQSSSSVEETFQLRLNYSTITTNTNNEGVAPAPKAVKGINNTQNHQFYFNNLQQEKVQNCDDVQRGGQDLGMNMRMPAQTNGMDHRAFSSGAGNSEAKHNGVLETQTPGRNFKTISKLGAKHLNTNVYHTPVRHRPPNVDALNFNRLHMGTQQNNANGTESSPRDRSLGSDSKGSTSREQPRPNLDEDDDNILDITRLKMLPKLL